MRILWHGVDPRYPTGYGLQTALFAPRLAALGHDVVISCLQAPPEGTAVPGRYEGLKVIGPAAEPGQLPHLPMQREFGLDGPDLIITLKDCWTLPASDFRRFRTLALCPVDTNTMSVPDREFFSSSGAVPGAISRHGMAVMREQGLDPVYVPHGIELAQWRPPADKAALREWLGLSPATFIAGMNAVNSAGQGFPARKGFDEAFQAFAAFSRRHPDSLLFCHTVPFTEEGIDLLALRHYHGLDERVIFPGEGMTRASHDDLLSWYQALDVFLAPTYGEGFGIPIAEALACGVPVIGTDCTTLPELVAPGAGWLVKGQQWWNPHHITHWTIPSVAGLVGALNKAYARRLAVPAGYCAGFDADVVTREHWVPALEKMSTEPGNVAVLTRPRRAVLHVKPAASVAVLVPSRGRPASVARLAAAVKETAQLGTKLWFGFDEDDPALAENVAAAKGAWVVVRPRMGLAPWTNTLAAEAAGADMLVSMGDDHLPRTPGWDAELVKALRGVGMAYPNDLVRDDICEAVAISAEIVAALGWMTPPGLDHWFIDGAWADLGKAAGCLTYCPDVIVEHLHHSQHKDIPYDPTYSDAWRKLAADKMAYERWKATGLPADAARVAEVVNGG